LKPASTNLLALRLGIDAAPAKPIRLVSKKTA
jgi:hypothetical protein